MHATHCPHHSKVWDFSSESKLPESAKLRTLRQTLPTFGNAFLVTIPNGINRLVGGLANTPTPRTASPSHVWAWPAWTVGKSHVTPHPTTTSNLQNIGGSSAPPALAARHSPPRTKGHTGNNLCCWCLSRDFSSLLPPPRSKGTSLPKSSNCCLMPLSMDMSRLL